MLTFGEPLQILLTVREWTRKEIDEAIDKANASGGSTKRSKGSPSPFGSLKEEGSTKPLKALFSK